MFPRLATSLFVAGLSLLGPDASAADPRFGGVYAATINGDSFESSGRFRMVLSRGGIGSVSVCVGDEPPCVVGVGYNPVGYGIIVRSGDPDMILNLKLVTNPDDTISVVGTVEDEGEVFTIHATQAVKSVDTAKGAHTFVLGTQSTSADIGSGYAKVAASGRVAGVLQVGTHRPVSFGGLLTPDLKLPVGVRFGKTESSLVGDLTFADVATGGTAKLHDEETTTDAFSWRANYLPRLRPLVGTPGAFALATTINGTACGTATQLNNGAIVGAKVEGLPAKVKIVRGTGLVTGGTKAHAFRGVVLQDLDVLTGLSNGTAEFSIESTGPVSTNAGNSGGLVKTGGGTLVVVGSNNYAGFTIVSGGTLTGTMPVIETGALSVTGVSTFNSVPWLTTDPTLGGEQFTLITNSDSFLTGNTGNYMISYASDVLGGSSPNANSLPVPNSVSTIGSPGPIAVPSGTLALTGAHTYTSGTTITSGMLTVNGGTLNLTGGSNGTVTMNTLNPPLTIGVLTGATLAFPPLTVATPASTAIGITPEALLAAGWTMTAPGTYVSPTGQCFIFGNLTNP